MKAILCNDWGKPDDLVLADVPSPVPGPGEILLGIHACGINFADTVMIAGQYQVRPPHPFSPGLEVAGEVLEVGEGVTQVKLGDRVMAVCGYGGYAEELVIPASLAVPIPDSMDYATAASFAVAYGTSHIALTHRGQLQAGEVLLVHGAAGGVGLTAVELGKLLGATVIATASTQAKLDLVAKYGADHLINYKEEDFRTRVKELTNGKGADVIYDPVGGDVFAQSLRCINWRGRLLVIGFAGGQIPQAPANILLVKNISVVGVHWGAYLDREPEVMQSSLAQLVEWHAAGKLSPHISHRLPLEEASTALNMLINRQATGKIVLDIRA